MAIELRKMRNGYSIYHDDDHVGSVLKHKGNLHLRLDEYVPISDVEQIISRMKELQNGVVK